MGNVIIKKNMQNKPINFSDIRNHLYDKAEKYWWGSLLLGFAVQIIAGFSTFTKNSTLIVISEIILFGLPILARWLQEVSKDSTSRAMKCRLAILYSDGLGDHIPSSISKEIKSWAKPEEVAEAPFEKPYYDSKLPTGPNRLADIVAESAFWTYNLADKMRCLMSIYLLVYMFVAIGFLYFLFQTGLNSAVLMGVSRIIVILISLVFSSEAILLVKQFNELYSETKIYFGILEKLSEKDNVSSSEVMQVIEGYNLLLISSPPIPSLLYRANQTFLNKAYKDLLDNE